MCCFYTIPQINVLLFTTNDYLNQRKALLSRITALYFIDAQQQKRQMQPGAFAFNGILS